MTVLGLPHLAVQAGCAVHFPLSGLSPGPWPQTEQGHAPHVVPVSAGLHLDPERENGDDEKTNELKSYYIYLVDFIMKESPALMLLCWTIDVLKSLLAM